MMSIHTLPPLSAQALQTKLLRLGLIYGGGAFILNGVLFFIMVAVTTVQLPLLSFITMGVLITVLISDYVGIKLSFEPIYRHLKALEQSPLSSEARQDLYIRLLNYPIITVFRVFTFHTLPPYAVLLIMMTYLIYIGLLPWSLVEYSIIMTLLVVGVATHAILEYFAVKRLLYPSLLYAYYQAGDLSATARKRIISLGIYRRLFTLSVWLMLVPVTVLGITLIIRVANTFQMFDIDDATPYLLPLMMTAFAPVVVIGGVMVIVIRHIATEIAHPTDELVKAMQLVADGQLDVLLPITTADEFAELNHGFNQMVKGLQERERLHDAFGRYISPELATRVREQGASLSAQMMNASVMFVDIRNYTAMAEKLSPIEVVTILNRFFAVVEPLIQQQGGWINKFLGDGFMVLFGVPVPYDDHAKRAVRVARQIRDALADLNIQHAGQFPSLSIGIGIDCGDLVAGSIGSPDRIEYTVIGDVVNIASRIESLNKELGTTILISEAVYLSAGDVGDNREMPPTSVKGKSVPIRVYALD